MGAKQQSQPIKWSVGRRNLGKAVLPLCTAIVFTRDNAGSGQILVGIEFQQLVQGCDIICIGKIIGRAPDEIAAPGGQENIAEIGHRTLVEGLAKIAKTSILGDKFGRYLSRVIARSIVENQYFEVDKRLRSQAFQAI